MRGNGVKNFAKKNMGLDHSGCILVGCGLKVGDVECKRIAFFFFFVIFLGHSLKKEGVGCYCGNTVFCINEREKKCIVVLREGSILTGR